MRTKASVGVVMVFILTALLVFGVGRAFAQEAPTDTAATSILLRGRITIVQDEEGQRLQMTADAPGTGGWHLETLLAPAAIQRFGREGARRLVLRGRFILQGSAGTVQGLARATLDQQGNATLQLTDSSSGTDLNASFRMTTGGSLTLTLQGQGPAFPGASATPSGATALAGNHFFWYLSRSAAFTAYGLLFLNVCLGLLMHTGWTDDVLARWRIFDWHQFTALLAMAFLGVHVLSLLGDHFFDLSVGQLLVPLASPYRPSWSGLGTVSLYLLAAIVGSFYVRRYIGRRAWQALHYATFAAFIMVLVHGLSSGTDSSTTWARLVYLSTGSTVALLTLWRVRYASLSHQPGSARERIPIHP